MEKIKNILLIVLILLCTAPMALAEKLPRNIIKFEYGGPDTYVPYRQYFSEYTERLSKAFQPKGKFPWRGFLFTTVRYLIHKDGRISDLKITDSCTEEYMYYTSKFNPIGRYRTKNAAPKMDKYAMEVVQNNPPKPFLEGIDYDVIQIEVQFCYYPRKKEIYYDINGADFYNTTTKKYYPPEFTIYLCHDSRKILRDKK